MSTSNAAMSGPRPTERDGRLRRIVATVRTVIALIMLATPTLALGWNIVKERRFTPGELALLVGLGLAVYGLAFARPWGRWGGLGLAISGLLFGAAARGLILAVVGPTSVALLLCLLGPMMARRFELSGSPGAPWRASGWQTALLNWAVILGVAALPALALWTAPGATRSTWNVSAALAAALLVAATVLVSRQRAAGLLALLAGGLASGLALLEGFSGLTNDFNACSGWTAGDVAQIFAVSTIPAIVAAAIVLPVVIAALSKRNNPPGGFSTASG